MIKYETGNIFWSTAEALVNPVNCVGIMGKGLAADFRGRFPENHIQYKLACQSGELKVGKPFAHKEKRGMPRYVVNFPTKRHWKNQSRIEDIEMGLINLAGIVTFYEIKSIAVPALGCGLGGLEWEPVKALIEEYMSDLDATVYVFEPKE